MTDALLALEDGPQPLAHQLVIVDQ